MSVLIKGMQMPEDCFSCPLREEGFCNITKEYAGKLYERNGDCPLVELPEHHSRLIDADKMKQWFFRPYSNEESYSNIDIARIIDSQVTIVEAE